MHETRRVALVIPLLLVTALVATASDAAPPSARTTPARAPDTKPLPRKQIKLSPEVQARLTRPTVKQTPVRHVPFTSREVRAEVPANERPTRSTGKAKPRRLSNAELTKELNEIERKLNAQGYSLRDNRSVVVHEHQPDRAKLDQQVRKIERVVQVKPERAPVSGAQLRAKVRSSVKPRARGNGKPPARRTGGRGAETNGFWVHQSGPSPAASTGFQWTPQVGEAAVASAFLDTRASFSGELGGLAPGLNGSIVVTAGAHVFNQRLDALRLEASMTASLDGDYEAAVTATLPGGYVYPIHESKGTQPINVDDLLSVFNQEQRIGSTLLVAGFPVTIDLIVNPSLTGGFSAEATGGAVFGELKPKLHIETTLEAYTDLGLARAGGGGKVVLISATPEISGAVYITERDGQTTIESELSGWLRFGCLEGRIYAFLEIGWGFLSKRFETELMDYDGWSWAYPISYRSSSRDP